MLYKVNQRLHSLAVTASGGYGTLSWSITRSLPTGLSINGATVPISGTAGSYANANTYTVVVQDLS
jgi:hypothetical protein